MQGFLLKNGTRPCEMGRILVTKYHLIALSLIGVLPHFTGLWNVELKAGIGFQIIANLVAASAFVVFYSSIAELTSTFPFAGGSYAFARCTVGFYLGYLVGCIEVFYYILLLVYTNGAMLVFIRGDNITIWKNQNYIILALFVSNFVMCISKKWVYNMFVILAIYGLSMNLIYVFGSIQFVDFNTWAYIPRHTDDDTLQFVISDDDNGHVASSSEGGGLLLNITTQRVFQAFTTILWVYKGLEFINLMSEDVVAPSTMIPLAQVIGTVALVVFNTSVPVIGASMYPGIERLIKLASACSPGFSRIFNVTHDTATYMALPMLFGLSNLTCYSITKLIAAMAESRLFPRVLAKRVWSTRTPVYALGLTCCMALLVLGFMAVAAEKYFPHFTTITGVFSLLTYCMQLLGFIVLRLKLSAFSREFRSPFGIPGAIFCMIVFLAGICCALSITHRGFPTIVIGIVYVTVASAYYFWFAKHSQTFSADEKAVVLPAHVGIKNANEYLYSKFPCFGAIVAFFFKGRQLKPIRYRFSKGFHRVSPALGVDVNTPQTPQKEESSQPLAKQQMATQADDVVAVKNQDMVPLTRESYNDNQNISATPVCLANRVLSSESYATSCVVNVSQQATEVAFNISPRVVPPSSKSCPHSNESGNNGFDNVENNNHWHIVDLHPLPFSHWKNNNNRSFQQLHGECLQQQQRVHGAESSSSIDMDIHVNNPAE